MTQPYQVLGVDPSATDQQVQAAFQELQKKYHPDNYRGTPLEQEAAQKMQEATDAFDQIMNERRKNQVESGAAPTVVTTATVTDAGSGEDGGRPDASSQAGPTQGGYQGAGSAQSSFSDIRRLIQDNRLVEAEELLDGTPQKNRDAEWYFLKGTVFFTRGWLDDATGFFSTAVRMNPNNPEYQAALNRVMWQRQGNFGSGPGNSPYRTGQPNATGCSACDVCTGLLCADCCCECAGGDLIPCC